MPKRRSMTSEGRTARSPYQRYRKAPYRYSDILEQWQSAVIKGDYPLARRLGQRHSERFGPRDLKLAA